MGLGGSSLQTGFHLGSSQNHLLPTLTDYGTGGGGWNECFQFYCLLVCLARKGVGWWAKFYFRLSVGLEYAVDGPDPKSRAAGNSCGLFSPSQPVRLSAAQWTDVTSAFFQPTVSAQNSAEHAEKFTTPMQAFLTLHMLPRGNNHPPATYNAFLQGVLVRFLLTWHKPQSTGKREFQLRKCLQLGSSGAHL